MLVAPAAAGRFALLRNRPLLTLMLGHFTVDLYGGLLPVLYPVLTGAFKLNLQTVGLVTLAYSGVGSLSQPIFGWLADHFGFLVALRLQAVVTLLSIAVAWLLPSEGFLRGLSRSTVTASPATAPALAISEKR